MPTDFQKRVYSLILRIPKGKVMTYKLVAKALGIKAYRAIGIALKKNPFAPQVPCHRIICSDGSLGGYSAQGGTEEKKTLLLKEGIYFLPNNKVDIKKHLFSF